MRRLEPRLQSKLLAWLLGPLLGLLALDTLVTYSTSLNFSNLAYDRSLQEIAREVRLHVKPDGTGLKVDMSPATERVLLLDQDDRLFYKVSTEDGKTVAGEAALPPPPQAVKPGQAVFYDAALHGESVRVVASRMSFEDGAAGGAAGARPVLVQVAETRNKRNHLAREILANVVLPQLLLIVFATAAVIFGIKRGLVPLQRLQHAVSDRSHLDLSPIEIRDVPGEVRPLVDEVNDLMLRLGKTLDFQNRFIADAAHQLKTPVAGIKAQIELALRENDAGAIHHQVAQLYVSADRLSRLVGQLLSLARNEPGAAEAVRLQTLDLDALALEITMEWVPEALRRSIDLGFESADATVAVDGDPHRLRELLNNLIDNAVRYSQHGGRVTVKVAGGGQPRLMISDDGPRIPVEERERIFERFHRLLGSHTDGSGLGLAIVSEIAALHQAHITLEEDRDGIGNTFTVFFPLPGSRADSPGQSVRLA
jgi:two-component system sensor histidine kinase TctE